MAVVFGVVACWRWFVWGVGDPLVPCHTEMDDLLALLALTFAGVLLTTVLLTVEFIDPGRAPRILLALTMLVTALAFLAIEPVAFNE